MFEHKGLKISWLGHDSFMIQNGKTVIIDPFKLQKNHGPADVLLITHEHFDHCSPDDIKRVASPQTIVITTPSARTEVGKMKVKDIRTVKPGESVQLDKLMVKAVPAYNLNKFREPGKVFHPKEDMKVGFVIEMKGVRVYHAGDTDSIPEMKGLHPDVALIPVSGTYVMTAEEAAEAAGRIAPSVAIPMHYGTIVGSERDALRFKELAPCPVKILEREV